MIEVEDVSASFGDVQVLDGVDLSIDRGEFVGLVGPNGAGKTTLVRIVNGSLGPDAGVVRVDGDRLAGLSSREAARRVATVPQDTSVQFAFDVETIVAMGRTPHRSRFGRDPDGHEYVERALERTGVDDLRARRISEVSGGERQRVFVARALAQDAPTMVLDEPTASLDINHAAQTLSLVRDVVTEGTGALAAIHDLEAAARYCDRIVLLADGHVVERGPPEDVLTTDAIARAFDTHSAVTTNPVTDAPSITALPAQSRAEGRVHVLGGGRTGASAIGDLWSAGYDVTAGPLPNGDAAADVARSLDVEVLTVPGLSQPDDATLAEASALIERADTALLVDVDLPADGTVLSVAEAADALGVVEGRPLAERNHGGVEIRRRYERLRDRAAVGDPNEAVAVVEATAMRRPVNAGD